MRLAGVVMAVFVAAQASAQGQGCFVDNLPTPGNTDRFDAMMRTTMMAHIPLEYRNSCGMLDDTDQRYYDAIRQQVGCGDSEGYDLFFGRYLGDLEEFVFAVKRTDLRTEATFETYCAIIGRIDLTGAVDAEGKLNAAALQVQAPLFQALQDHVNEWRLQ